MAGTGEEREIVARGGGPGAYGQTISIGPHRLIADEPAEVGGLDAGPAPHELVFAGLAGCTAITLRMYAGMKKLPLEDVIVRVQRITGEVADGDGKTRRESRLVREITLMGPLDAAARERLLAIANRCPVHRLLAEKVEIDSRLVEAAPAG